jgi:hypothetical protein
MSIQTEMRPALWEYSQRHVEFLRSIDHFAEENFPFCVEFNLAQVALILQEIPARTCGVPPVGAHG